MIVKNEEKVIERCLSSVAHLVDEVIVVDTGSIDRTKEIVSGYTTKIYDFKWINDFAAARNFAAKKASAEWILVLDADEYIEEENFLNFIEELKVNSNNFDAFSAKILNFTGGNGEGLVQNLHDRIYRNNGDICYHRSIHEQFKSIKGKLLNIGTSKLVVFHSGYLMDTVNEKGKNLRNKSLLSEEMKQGANKAFDFFNLGNEYSSLGDYSKALDHYLEAYKLKKDYRLSWVSTTLVQIIICLMHLKRYNDALNVINDAVNIYENSPEFPFLKGEIFFVRGQMDDAKEMFLNIVNNNDRYNNVVFRPDLKDQRPHTRLGEIYLYEEDFQNAIFHYTSVLNINKYDNESIQKVIYILNKFHTSQEITEFIFGKKLIDSKNVLKYLKASFDVGNPELSMNILNNFDEDNKILYQVAIMKKICITNEGNLNEIYDILDIDMMQKLLQAKWVNIVDLILLREFKDDQIVAELLSKLESNDEYSSLVTLINENNYFGEIREELLLFSLKTLIIYNKNSICNGLLPYIATLDTKVVLKVASLLFHNGFRVEALQLYDKCDWNYFNEQDFTNIIKSLDYIKEIGNAIEVSKLGSSIFQNNFNFYKYILENTVDEDLYNNTLINALNYFKESPYMVKLNNVKN